MNEGGCLENILTNIIGWLLKLFFGGVVVCGLAGFIPMAGSAYMNDAKSSKFLVVVFSLIGYALFGYLSSLITGGIFAPKYERGSTKTIAVRSVGLTVFSVVACVACEIAGFVMVAEQGVRINALAIIGMIILIAANIFAAIRRYRKIDQQWYEQYSQRSQTTDL